MSLPCWKCSFFTIRSISCFRQLFCSTGATSDGGFPLRMSWVVRAESEKENTYKNESERVLACTLTVVNCPDSLPVNSGRQNTLAVHILDAEGSFGCRENWVGVWVTGFHYNTCHPNAGVLWYKNRPCGITLMPDHLA